MSVKDHANMILAGIVKIRRKQYAEGEQYSNYNTTCGVVIIFFIISGRHYPSSEDALKKNWKKEANELDFYIFSSLAVALTNTLPCNNGTTLRSHIIPTTKSSMFLG